MSKRLPVYVEERQIDELLNAAFFDDSFEGTRDRLMLEIFYSCGLRRSELNKLTWQSIDLHLKQIKVLGKGGKERIIPIDERLIGRTTNFHALCKTMEIQSAFLFTTRVGELLNEKALYSIVKHYLSRIPGLEKKSPHVLRHSFATHLSNHGADLNAIKELLGHSNLAATQVYTHNSIEKLKKTFKQAHPRS
jgi:integrase/recombinase XerC